MHRKVLAVVCVALLTFVVVRQRSIVDASELSAKSASFEDTYAGWSREQLIRALEALRKGRADDAVLRGDDAENDPLAAEIEWLTDRTRPSASE